MDIDTLQRARKSYAELAALTSATSPGPSSPPSGFFDNPSKIPDKLYSRYRYLNWKSSWSYDEELVSLECNDANLKAIRRTKLGGAFAPALKEMDATFAEINQHHNNALSHFMFGGMSTWNSNLLLKFADTEAARRLLVTAIALKRHQLRPGNYPADLNALVPEFLPKVPVDLMDGRPLRYRLEPDGTFLLYSVGEDGEDNGGDPTPMDTQIANIQWLKSRDIVWPQPATAAEVAAYLKKSYPPAAIEPAHHRDALKNTNAPAGTNGTGK